MIAPLWLTVSHAVFFADAFCTYFPTSIYTTMMWEKIQSTSVNTVSSIAILKSFKVQFLLSAANIFALLTILHNTQYPNNKTMIHISYVLILRGIN